MQSTGLVRGQPQRITPAGAMLHLVNHPELDYNLTAFSGGASSAGYVLLGFDRSPTAQGYDAIVPPFCEALVPVPAGVKAVNLLWPLDLGARIFRVQSTTLTLGFEWNDCPAEPYIRPFGLLPPVVSGFLAGWNDGANGAPANGLPPGNPWMPSLWTPILDQGVSLGGGAAYDPHLRPILAPARAITNSAGVALNTLTNLFGVVARTDLSTGSVLKRLIISASAAGLVVVGDSALTVATPSPNEAARVRFAAATPQPIVIDYGEGLELSWNGHGGTWQYYASAAMTVDITAILG